MVPDKDFPLANSAILVTRPGEKGAELVQTLRSLGAMALSANLMGIELLGRSPAVNTALSEIKPGCILVFVSVNAVNAIASALPDGVGSVFDGARIAAVGAATAQALEALGIQVDLTPEKEMNSEGLLALFEDIALPGQQVFLFRGQSGRELLGRTFRQRGANVIEVESYKRRFLQPDLTTAIAELSRRGQRSVIVTSVELLTALVDCIDGAQKEMLFSCDLIALSERIADAAVAAGFCGRIAIAQETGNSGLVIAAQSLAGSVTKR